jgi:hypothetical protein
MTLKPLIQTCTPRADVLAGQFAAADFAARLEQVVSDPAGYADYGDPARFFALTYPTGGMKRLLTGVFGRSSGQDVPGAENPVVRFQTSFGGGKTHGLIAAYHVATGYQPAVEFFDDGFDVTKLPADMRVAALVGEQIDPVNGVDINGLTAYTLWGAIGAQLGPDAWAEVEKSDQERTPPGTGTIKKMLAGKPTVVIVDEIAQYLRVLSSAGSDQVKALASSLPAFLKSLFEVASEKGSRLVVVVTLATEKDAYGKETDQVQSLLDSTVGEAGSVLARQEAMLIPAKDDEIAAILRRRLFDKIEDAAATAAGSEYQAMYEALVSAGETLPSGAAQPATYGAKIAASYPFHPELVRVLDSRIATIPTFQRARGALRLLAAAIHHVWDAKDDTVMLNIADLPLEAEKVLYELTERLQKERFKQVAAVDIAGSKAHAAEVDQARFAGRPFATRAATCVFLHSLEQVSTVGAGRSDYLLGCLRPGDTPEVYDEALNALSTSAWHLSFDNVRWKFQIEANARAVVAEEADNIAASMVTEEMERKVAQAFGSIGGKVKAIHEPSGASDVPDEAALHLVVFHPDDSAGHVTNPAAPLPAPSKVRDIATKAGVGANNRKHRNGVVFLCPDPTQVAPLKQTIRRHMAAERILGSEARRQDLGPDVVKQVQQIKDAGDIEVVVAVTRCFAHLYYPARDKTHDDLHHHELPAKTKGEIQGKGASQTQAVLDTLRGLGKIKPSEPALAPSYLRSKTWASQDEITLDKVHDWFWVDPSLEMPVDTTRIVECVRSGVKIGEWVYYEADSEKVWTDKDAPPPVRISSDSFLMTPDRAAEAGVIAAQLTAALVEEVVQAAGGQIGGSDLYDKLEEEVGKRPTKKELTAILARVAVSAGSRLAVVEGEPDEGKVQLSASQLDKSNHDKLTFLTRAAATKAGVVAAPTAGGPKIVSAEGAAAVAFAKTAEKAGEVTDADGVSWIKATATADPGEGVGDLKALGAVIAMTPKLSFNVELNVDLGLPHGTASIYFDGPGADYQKLESDLMKFAGHAAEASGQLTLTASTKDDSPIKPGVGDWQNLAENCSTLNPGHLVVETEVHTKDDK